MRGNAAFDVLLCKGVGFWGPMATSWPLHVILFFKSSRFFLKRGDIVKSLVATAPSPPHPPPKTSGIHCLDGDNFPLPFG